MLILFYVPVSREVNSGGDAVGVVRGKAEGVVLLEVLIGSDTESKKRNSNRRTEQRE